MERHRVSRRTLSIIAAVALAGALAVGALLYFSVLTVAVTIDGHPTRVLAGTTAGELVRDGKVEGRPGDLVAVASHAVLKAGAGGPVVVLVDRRPVSPTQKLKADDAITTRNGANAIEPLKSRTQPVAPSVRYIGSGPLQTIVTSGTPGVETVRYGAISGQVASRRVTREPIMKLVVRTRPSGGGSKVIALTFDDGPWPGTTAAIVKILKENQVTATFFEIGRSARAHPELSRIVAAAGMALGNHSESHPDRFNRLSAAQVASQITAGENDITAASGQRPAYFRPPGGNVSPAMYPVLAGLRMQWVQWDVDPGDWKRPATETIVNRVLTGAWDGAVVLMHDGGGDRSHTIEALPIIIRALKAQGYRFVKLDALKSLPHRMG